MAASTTAFTSAMVTAERSATLPVPDTTPAGNASAALAVPPVTSTELPVPSVSLARVSTPPSTRALPPSMAALMTAATSSGVALAMSPKSAVRKVTVCSGPPSMRSVSVWPSASANGGVPPAADLGGGRVEGGRLVGAAVHRQHERRRRRRAGTVPGWRR